MCFAGDEYLHVGDGFPLSLSLSLQVPLLKMEAIGIRVWGYVEDKAAGNHEKRGSEGRMKGFGTI